MLKHINCSAQKPKNMLIHDTVFYCELFSWLSARSPTLLMLAGVLHGWPLVCYQLNGLILPFVSIFVCKHFIPSIFNCLCIVQKHLAQTCYSITLADSQSFYQRFVFEGKTHSLQTWKYDDRMTSPVANKM